MNKERNIYKDLLQKIQNKDSDSDIESESNSLSEEHESGYNYNEKIKTRKTTNDDTIDEKINNLLLQKITKSKSKPNESIIGQSNNDSYTHFIKNKCSLNNSILLDTHLELNITCFKIQYIKNIPYICYLLMNNSFQSIQNEDKDKNKKQYVYECHFPSLIVRNDQFKNVYEMLEYTEEYIQSLIHKTHSNHDFDIEYYGILKNNVNIQTDDNNNKNEGFKKQRKVHLVYEIKNNVKFNDNNKTLFWCNKFEIIGDKMIYGKYKIANHVVDILSPNEMFDMYNKDKRVIMQPITCYQINNDEINKLNRNFNGKYGPYYYFMNNNQIFKIQDKYKQCSRYHSLIGNISDKPFITNIEESYIHSWSDKFDSFIDDDNIVIKNEENIRYIGEIINSISM